MGMAGVLESNNKILELIIMAFSTDAGRRWSCVSKEIAWSDLSLTPSLYFHSTQWYLLSSATQAPKRYNRNLQITW